MDNGHLLLSSKCSIFHNILKNLTFQRHPKVLVWSKGLNNKPSKGRLGNANLVCLALALHDLLEKGYITFPQVL